MEIEKQLVVSAPREKVWALLLDPHVMTGAVPGMQSIDVLSPTEYVALMKVKISFISAKFRLHTHIVEQREPEYLKVEGTGEDASVASSLKQTSEIFLTDTPEGGTALRLKVNVDVLGRLGTFGLSVMKTKADRMWEEFGKNLTARLEAPDGQEDSSTGSTAAATDSPSDAKPAVTALANYGIPGDPAPKGWLGRLFSAGKSPAATVVERSGGVIRIEIRQTDKVVTVEWPVEAAGQCQEWLRDVLKV